MGNYSRIQLFISFSIYSTENRPIIVENLLLFSQRLGLHSLVARGCISQSERLIFFCFGLIKSSESVPTSNLAFVISETFFG